MHAMTRRGVLRAGGVAAGVVAIGGARGGTRGGSGSAVGAAAGLGAGDARLVANALATDSGRKLAQRLAALGFERTYLDRVRQVGDRDHVVYVGFARRDGATGVLADLRSDGTAGGATTLEATSRGLPQLNTYKLDPAGHVVKRQCALPYPIPGDADDPWRTQLRAEPVTA
jgi:hypothetical protein